MQNGVIHSRTEGTPQGGPLSPLLANILLTDFDRELEKRGHRFVRYADIPEMAGYAEQTIGNRLGAEQACQVV